MGTIHIKEFTGGLDTRRLRETTPGGVLIRAVDGHVTRGGEFEKRKAFVPVYDLPEGTVGLATDKGSLVVFGTTPGLIVPSGVAYQQITPPSGADISRLLSYDTFAGKTYAVIEFDDGSVQHYYDGDLVENWFDGRARAQFSIVSGEEFPATYAYGYFTITSGLAGAGNQITDVTVGGVSVMTAPVLHTGSNATTAAAVAADIAANSGATGYTATSTGAQVAIRAVVTGPAANGKTVVPVPGGVVAVGGIVNMYGGANETASEVTDIRVGGVPIILAPVYWAGSREATAEAVADAINAASSTPEYTATAVEATVNLVAASSGTAANGLLVSIDTANNMVVDGATTTVLAGGVASETGYTPGTFVKTIRSKMYATAAGLLHYSGISDPTGWTTDSTGAGFDDLSVENAGADTLVALARYQSMLAVFAPSVVVIWYIDPDPNNNTISQILDNTGTEFPLSVTQFGDADVFYLDNSGLRSLRARDSSNAAATTDLGVPVDDAITAKLASMSGAEKNRIVGLINPEDKRFWLIMKDEVFVFSFYQNAKVSAWTTYSLSTRSGATSETFEVENALAFQGRVYVRSGDTIYAYGGLDGASYDSTQAEAWLPLLDANMPTQTKVWTGVDAAVRGVWQISAAMEPSDDAAVDVVANVCETTYNAARVPLHNVSTHLGLRFRSSGPGPAVLSAAVIHYASDEGEDG